MHFYFALSWPAGTFDGCIPANHLGSACDLSPSIEAVDLSRRWNMLTPIVPRLRATRYGFGGGWAISFSVGEFVISNPTTSNNLKSELKLTARLDEFFEGGEMIEFICHQFCFFPSSLWQSIARTACVL
jgi:hypothetical protein